MESNSVSNVFETPFDNPLYPEFSHGDARC